MAQTPLTFQRSGLPEACTRALRGCRHGWLCNAVLAPSYQDSTSHCNKLTVYFPVIMYDVGLQVPYIDIIQTHDIEFGDIDQVSIHTDSVYPILIVCL